MGVNDVEGAKSPLFLAGVHMLMTFVSLSFGGYNVLMAKVTDFPTTFTEKEKFCRQTAFIFYRISSAMLLMILCGVLFYRSQLKLPANRWHTLSYGFQGLTGIFSAQYLFLLGLGHTSPTDAAVVQATTPLIVVFLAVLSCMETLTFKKVVGFCLGVGGAVVTLGPSILQGTSSDTLGYMLLLIQTASEASFLLVLKKETKRPGYTFFVNTMYQYIFGSMVMAGTAAYACHDHIEAFETPGIDSYFTWIALVYAIVIAGSINYSIMTFSCRHLEASSVGFYGLIQPFATAVFAYFAFGTTLNWRDFVGMVMIVFGIVIVNWPVKQSVASHVNERDERDGDADHDMDEPLLVANGISINT